MSRSKDETTIAQRTSDNMLIGIPIFAMLLVIFPIGPIGAIAGMLLAVISLLLAYGRPPSQNRTSLMICSVIALIGTGAVTVALIVAWLR